MKLKLGTRGSDLARTQSSWVAAALAAHGVDTELVVISTAGDRSTAPSFGAIGPQGVFVREIEQALIAGEVDIAVHSYKDLPTASPAELVVAAVPDDGDAAVRSDALQPAGGSIGGKAGGGGFRKGADLD
ncbi:MAG: hydroxymethylbilane synthase, partial [Gammaproteobacteria bacterium]|nr:hydroxymethylbilane synthase [Gammaproteobacteria bacterium]